MVCICFGKLYHGMGMQMTSNGTGIYYKPGIKWRQNTQILVNIGAHFNNHMQSVKSVALVNRSSSINMDFMNTVGLFKNIYYILDCISRKTSF